MRVHFTPSRFVVAGEDGCYLVVVSDGRAGEDGGEMAGEDSVVVVVVVVTGEDIGGEMQIRWWKEREKRE
ncbi:hypothetical protein A2U01_0052354 [Trifolium medium]|uniref:Uncharacterized protein n=1 Tax=Trifolium medium TaxID=97028 RepID=A0A392R3K9_9FABA|nr:hypothetical protein [Trifolium medium]